LACAILGYSWDGTECYPPVRHGYGGHYQKGEKPVVHQPDCETANPDTGRCTCPPGFTPHSAGFTVEPNNMWDHNSMCVRSN
jgi:hypothetical protein